MPGRASEAIKQAARWRVRKIVFFQRAQIEALKDYAVAHISDLARVDRKAASEEYNKLVRQTYEEVILKLIDQDPDVARDVDVRRSIQEPSEKMKWYFPEDQTQRPL